MTQLRRILIPLLLLLGAITFFAWNAYSGTTNADDCSRGECDFTRY